MAPADQRCGHGGPAFYPIGIRSSWHAGHDLDFLEPQCPACTRILSVGPLPEMATAPLQQIAGAYCNHLSAAAGSRDAARLWTHGFRRRLTTTIPSSHSCSTLFDQPCMILFGIAGGAYGNIDHPDPVLLPVFPDPPKGPQHILLAAVSIAIQHLQGNDPTARRRTPVFSHRCSAVSCQQSCHMGAVPIVVIGPPFIRRGNHKTPRFCQQNLYAHKSRYP